MNEVSYKFNQLQNWNHEIHQNMNEFYETHKAYPNVILTNETTARRLDALLSMELYEKGEKKFIQGLSQFCTKDYCVQFCADVELHFGSYALIYDEEAEFIDPDEALKNEEKGNYRHEQHANQLPA
jgi:hypothetical protein